MAGRAVFQINNAVIKLAATQAGLTAGIDYACQISSAAVVTTANTNTVPMTGCAPASDVPAPSSYALVLTWVQDWQQAQSLSNYAYTNDTQQVWWSITPNGLTAPVATGNSYVVSGDFGGDFGIPLTATATWPCLAKPSITAGAGTLEAPLQETAAA